MPAAERLEQQVPFEPGSRLPEAADVWWRTPVDERRLRWIELLSAAYTTVYVTPFFVLGALLIVLEPLLAPVSFLCLVHAWVIPELFAHRGARVLSFEEPPDGAGRGLLADLLDRGPAEIEAETGAVVERGSLGVWVLAEGGALLARPGGRRVHAGAGWEHAGADQVPSGDDGRGEGQAGDHEQRSGGGERHRAAGGGWAVRDVRVPGCVGVGSCVVAGAKGDPNWGLGNR